MASSSDTLESSLYMQVHKILAQHLESAPTPYVLPHSDVFVEKNPTLHSDLEDRGLGLEGAVNRKSKTFFYRRALD